MCFGSSASAPVNKPAYSLDQSNTAITQTATPVSADTNTTETVTPGATTSDKTVSGSIAGGSGLSLRM